MTSRVWKVSSAIELLIGCTVTPLPGNCGSVAASAGAVAAKAKADSAPAAMRRRACSGRVVSGVRA